MLKPVLIGTGQDEIAALLSGPAAPLLEALDPIRPNTGPSMWNGEVPFTILYGIYRLVAGLATADPLILMVDDVQCADLSSLRWLAYLVHRLRSTPVLVVLARRVGRRFPDEGVWREIMSVRESHSVRLAPLEPAVTARLVRGVFGPTADEQFQLACHDASGGNPFVLTEVLRDLSYGGVTPEAASVDAVHRYARQVLSDVVNQQLMAQPETVTQFTRAAAVLGDRCDLHLAAALAQTPSQAAAERAALMLEQSGILRQSNPVQFRSPLIIEVLLAQLDAEERQQTHRQAARLLYDRGAPSEQVAHHLLRAGPVGGEWAVTTLIAAARHALIDGRHDQVEDILLCVLQKPTTSAHISTVVDLLAETTLRGNPHSLIRHLRQRMEDVHDPYLYAKTAVALSAACYRAGYPAESILLVERVLDRNQSDEFTSLLQAYRLAIAACHLPTLHQVRNDPATRHQEVTSQDEPALASWRAFLRVGDGSLPDSERDDLGRSVSQIYLDDLLSDDLLKMLRIYPVLGVLIWTDQLERAAVWFNAITDRGLDICQRWPLAQYWLSEFHLRQGALTDALVQARHGLKHQQTWDYARHDVALASVLMDGYLEQGKLDEAGQIATQYHPAPADDAWTWCQLLRSRGRLRIAQGSVKQAVADLLECGRRLREWQWDNPSVCDWRSQLALAYAALSRHEEARHFAFEGLQLARELSGPRGLGICLRVAGLVTPGKEGLALLQDSVDILDDTQAPLELAYSLVSLGKAHLNAGHTATARNSLRRGVQLAERCGALSLAQHGDSLLRQAGARPRGSVRTGLDSLTAAERRVLQLASQEYSNKEIASELHISGRTVEIHLTHIYRKLGISGRKQLRQVTG